jgi:hypothetical protein
MGGLKLGSQFGSAVALSGDGTTTLIGGPFDGREAGAAWVFRRSVRRANRIGRVAPLAGRGSPSTG